MIYPQLVSQRSMEEGRFRAYLVGPEYVAHRKHRTLLDVAQSSRVGWEYMSNVTFRDGVFKAYDVTLRGLPCGRKVNGLLIVLEGSTEKTSLLLAYQGENIAVGFPMVIWGGDVHVASDPRGYFRTPYIVPSKPMSVTLLLLVWILGKLIKRGQ